MNTARRAALAAYSLLVFVLSLVLVAIAWDQGRQLDIDLGDFRFVSFVESSDAAKWAFTVVLGLTAGLAGLTFVLALLPDARRRKGELHLRQPDGSRIDITTGALEAIIQREVELLPDVRRAVPRVMVEGGQVATDLALVVQPGTVIAHISAAASHTALEALREHAGIETAKRPVVRVSYDGPAEAPPLPLAPQHIVHRTPLRFDPDGEERND